MWIVGKLVLSAIVVALIAVSPEVHAQLEPESSLIFGGISEPWQFLLKVGVCVGLFASLTQCARSLLDTASTTIGSPNRSQDTGGLNKSILFLSCLGRRTIQLRELSRQGSMPLKFVLSIQVRFGLL